jgi:hypothetical protein
LNRPSTWRGVPARSKASSSATQALDGLNDLNRRLLVLADSWIQQARFV